MVPSLKHLKKLILVVFALVGLVLSSCNENENQDDNTGIYSSITASCKLEKNYEGKDFFEEGIEEATLNKCSDGDTVSFILKNSGKFVNIRFYCVDTPESTGSVEKWGKAASNFTKEILESATEIVLESPTVPAQVDSYGSRYLSFVWYKNAEHSSWMNLNIQLIENGYSKNKALMSDPYYSKFKDAEAFAKKKPLRVWDDKADDPLYSDEAIEVTINEILTNTEQYYNDENSSGSKVRIEGYIKNVVISSTGTYTYQACEIVDGEEKVINIYTGYSSAAVNSNTAIKVGNKYSLTGTLQKYNGQLQISGITYVPMQSGGDYLTTLEKSCYLVFDSSIAYSAMYGTSKYSNLYKSAKVISAEIDGENIKISATAAQVTKDGAAAEATTFTFVVKNTDNLTDVSKLVGKTMTTGGLVVDTNTISIINYSNIVFK